jgi:hypothetical protein
MRYLILRIYKMKKYKDADGNYLAIDETTYGYKIGWFIIEWEDFAKNSEHDLKPLCHAYVSKETPTLDEICERLDNENGLIKKIMVIGITMCILAMITWLILERIF